MESSSESSESTLTSDSDDTMNIYIDVNDKRTFLDNYDFVSIDKETTKSIGKEREYINSKYEEELLSYHFLDIYKVFRDIYLLYRVLPTKKIESHIKKIQTYFSLYLKYYEDIYELPSKFWPEKQNYQYKMNFYNFILTKLETPDRYEILLYFNI